MPAAAVLTGLLALGGVALAGRPKVEVLPGDAQMAKGIPVARVYSTGPGVETQKGDRWSALADGAYVKTGDRLRTGRAAAAIEFPWTTLIVGAGSTLSIPPSIVLTAAVEEGRVEERAIGEDIVKLRTPEGVVRGSGHVIVRRHDGKTYVSAIEGAFDVATGPGTLRLEAGYGTIIATGERPSPAVELSRIGGAITPGTDPAYYKRNAPVSLRWESTASRHHLQVLAFDSERVVHDVEVTGNEYSIQLPLGLFRWRVLPVPADAPDGHPSADGFICIVDD
jgi:hypothetical protein